MAVDYQPGAVIAGHYRLDHLIGKGGMGVVWAATDTRTQRAVALKYLRSEAAADPETRRRFLREAQATSVIVHPNIVAIQDIAKTADGLPVLVMDLLDGEPLAALLHRERRLPLARAVEILAPVVSAVGAAHSLGIVHRDLKPDNIFLCRGGQGGASVKVLDFGIAKVTTLPQEAAAASVITGTWALLGTPYYMSPEQIIGERDIDHRSDIWALGVILYECLSGVRPAEAKTPGKIFEVILLKGIRPIAELVPNVPADIAKLIGRMLARERRDRPADLREVREVLARHTGVRPPPFGAPAPARLSNAGELSMPKSLPQGIDDPLDFDVDDERSSAVSEPPATLSAPSLQLPAEVLQAANPAFFPPPPPPSSQTSSAARVTQPAPASRRSVPGTASLPPHRGSMIRIAVVLVALAAGVGVGGWLAARRATNGDVCPPGSERDPTSSLDGGAASALGCRPTRPAK